MPVSMAGPTHLSLSGIYGGVGFTLIWQDVDVGTGVDVGSVGAAVHPAARRAVPTTKTIRERLPIYTDVFALATIWTLRCRYCAPSAQTHTSPLPVTTDSHGVTLMEYDWYLKKVPGGGWRDIRYRYGRGIRSGLSQEPFRGSGGLWIAWFARRATTTRTRYRLVIT